MAEGAPLRAVVAGTVVFPGTALAVADGQYSAGSGVYLRDGVLYASLAGHLQQKASEAGGPVELHVLHNKVPAVVPAIGSLVTGKVTKISQRVVSISIMIVEKTPLVSPYRGMLRLEDIRSTDKDHIEVAKCFRPNDIVVAEVLSLGDSRSFIVTTAKDHLGVVHATSFAGFTMKPFSAQEMVCTKSGLREFRKVAWVST
eukprot:RCo022707